MTIKVEKMVMPEVAEGQDAPEQTYMVHDIGAMKDATGKEVQVITRSTQYTADSVDNLIINLDKRIADCKADITYYNKIKANIKDL